MQMDNVQAEPIPSYPGYSVTLDERVWSEKSKKWLKVYTDDKGYKVTSLRKYSSRHTVGIHWLLLEAFVGPCPPGMECRHLDGNPSNNDLCNLKWGTRFENYLDMVRHHGRGRKLNSAQVRVIHHLLEYPEFLYREIGEIFNVHPTTIGSIAHGRLWSSVTGRVAT